VSEQSALMQRLKDALLALELERGNNQLLRASVHESIAIIGMSCRFPGGASSPEKFWTLLDEGIDAMQEIPASRWDVDAYFDANPDEPGKMYTRIGAFIDDVDMFDAKFFGISPREAEYMDPQQRLLLEVVWEAIENAGIKPRSLSGSNGGVFIGLMNGDYASLISSAEDIQGINAYIGSGNAFSAAVGRISYTFGLRGPSIPFDTACSSSLVAIDSACQSLRRGNCSMALAGGVNLMLSPSSYIIECKANMLSPDGHCKTFDESANGYARGEGCGVIVLKRLSDALESKDNILAVIKATGVNQDGASSGLTVPNGDAQQELIERVMAQAKVKPNDVDYIEAHGTGTSLGDPIEVNAIRATYGKGRDKHQPIILGSVKTNIGHTESAAGVAGIIKTVLSLQHQRIPKHLNFTKLNPHITLDFPAKIATTPIDWKRDGKPRVAAISSFGFSGTNAHVILEEAPKLDYTPRASLPLTKFKRKRYWVAALDEARHVTFKPMEQVSWKLLPSMKAAETATEKTFWLIFKDEHNIATNLIKKLNQHGHELISFEHGGRYLQIKGSNYSIDLTSKEQVEKLASYLKEENKKAVNVIYLWECKLPPEKDSVLAKKLLQNLTPLLNVLHKATTYGRLFVITQGLNDIQDKRNRVTANLQLSDFAESSAFKSSKYSIHIIDLDKKLNVLAVGRDLEKLVCAKAPEKYIALRGVKAYKPIIEEKPTKKDLKEVELPKLQIAPGDLKKEDTGHLIRDIISRILIMPVKEIDDSVGFFDMGFDSLMAVELVKQLQSVLGESLSIDIETVFNNPTITQLTEYVQLQLSGLPAVETKVIRVSYDKEQIAIIGMSCRFPHGADSPEKFWDLLHNSVDGVTEVPAERWNVDDYYDPDPDAPGKVYTRKGGFVNNIDQFDPQFFGISPREAIVMDPQQRLMLETSWEAIERSGYKPASLKNSLTGVFVGVSNVDYGYMLMQYGGPESISAQNITGTLLSAISGRLSYTFGFQGPSLSIDTACSSSLVSVHSACKNLLSGDCDLALGCGVNLNINPESSLLFAKARMLSADGYCKTFDEKADGYGRSEGCGVVVLKRLTDAIKDKDNILAVIKGSMVNQDGVSGGFTVPNGSAQEALMQRALLKADVKAADVDYIEAHGTGTSLGDPIEVAAIGKVYGSQHSKDKPLTIGAVKSNIGHTESAAGVASLIKVVLSLQHQSIPGNLHFEKLNPKISLDKYPINIAKVNVPWPKSDKPRIAGISSFGAYGTNAHVILEEAPKLDYTSRASLPITKFKRQRYWVKALDNMRKLEGGTIEHMKDWCLQIRWSESPQATNQERIDAYVTSHPKGLVINNARKLKIKVPPGFSTCGIKELHKDKLSASELIIYVTNKSSGAIDTKALGISQQELIAPLIKLIQQLRNNELSPQLVIVTHQAQSIDGVEINLAQAPLVGFIKTAVSEHPELSIRHIDIDEKVKAEQLSDIIINELALENNETQVVFRNNKRYLPKVITDIELPEAKSKLAINKQGTYLITGGLGGIGLSVANWLIENGAKHLCLTGRRTPSSKQSKTIKELESKGATILTLQADVAVADDIKDVIAKIKKSKAPLAGVIHAAGVDIKGSIVESKWSDFEKSLAAKVLLYLWHLMIYLLHILLIRMLITCPCVIL